MFGGNVKSITDTQKTILELLLSKNYMQKDLASAVGLSGAGLLYNLNKLEEGQLIEKNTITTVGTVSLKEISVNPNSIQQIREVLGHQTGQYTLISGFGIDSKLGKSSTIPAQVQQLLHAEGYEINRVVVFCTPESNLQYAQQLIPIDEVISFPYEDFRNDDSKFMSQLESLIQKEQQQSDVILDLTPLTKLLSIRLLEIAYKHRLPCLYLGKKTADQSFLLWIYRPELQKDS